MAKPISKQDIAEKVRLVLGNKAANAHRDEIEILATDPAPLSSQR